MQHNHSYHTITEGSAAAAPRISLLAGIVACVCIAVYLGAMVFAGIRVYTGIVERRVLASREFSKLADFSVSLGTGGMNDAAFEKSVTDEFSRLKTLQGAIFSSALGNYITLERNRGKVITWNELKETPDFKPQFGISKDPLSKPLQIGNQMVTFRAVYNYIDYEFLITILKRALLVVLATLCLALFTLIFQFLLANPITRPKPGLLIKEFRSKVKDRDAAAFFQDESPGDGKSGHKTTETPSDFRDERDEAAGAAVPPQPPQPQPPASAGSGTEDNGLYTSRSYIGQEAHTVDRLAAELKRCAAFEQDLVFMAVEMRASRNPDDREFRFLADEAVKFFLRRDLIFEKGEKGITVILPGVDLDEGFTKSEKFLGRVESKYLEAFGDAAKLFMGLSSRAERAIEAERLVFEASGALTKAWEDPSSPIVAFRSDPEKYRDFMDAQNKSRP